jgi:transposase
MRIAGVAGYISGENRNQSTLFPELLDDYVHEDNPIRIVDIYIDELDLNDLGFIRANPNITGRPGYSPATMLKIYLYGYLNRIQSSRRLERETHRNVELMWLTERLTPDFKTIADFRKDNGKGIKNVCRKFIEVCRNLNLFTDAVVAVDGSKFKAVNNNGKNFTKANIKHRIANAEKNINDYLARLDEFDKKEKPGERPLMAKKLVELKEHLAELQNIETKITSGETNQVSLTDPESRAMKCGSKGSVVGYNVQTAVDSKYHLIVGHYVTNTVVDRAQLHRIAKEAQSAIGQKDITVIADKGYYKATEIKRCQDSGMTPLVPKTQTYSGGKRGMFIKDDYVYDKEKDVYICPAKREIPFSYLTKDRDKDMRVYMSIMVCKGCNFKKKCTSDKGRRIRRWVHEESLVKMENQLKTRPETMRLRKAIVEHPFGTIKSWMGATHLQTKTLKRVSTEISLHVLAYNLTRMINLFGVKSLRKTIQS